MKPGSKNTMTRGLNLTLYLSFCVLLGTGALLFWRLVPGSEGGRGLALYGWSRHDWGDVHFWTGAVFLAATVLHLYVHRLWLKKIAGAASIFWVWLGLLAGVMLVAFFMVVPLDGRGGEVDHEDEAPVTERTVRAQGRTRADETVRPKKKDRKKARKSAQAETEESADGRQRRLRYRGGQG